MNEDTTRALVKAGMLHTSDEFARELMYKLERRNALRREFAKAFMVGCSCCVFILVLFAATSHAVTVFSLHFPAFNVKLIGVIVVVGLLNRLIAMKEALAAG